MAGCSHPAGSRRWSRSSGTAPRTCSTRAQEEGTFDLVEDFSFRLPLDVISELIGIPVEHRETVHDLSEQIAHGDGTE